MTTQLSDRLQAHVLELTQSTTGRSPGTQGHEQARNYILQTMLQAGLEPTDLGDQQDTPYLLQDHIETSWGRSLMGTLFALGFPIARPGTSNKGRYPVYNLAGMIRSKNPAVNSYRMIISHYDHLGCHGMHPVPGALDNGSGIAVNLELACTINQKQKEGEIILPHHLIFAFTDREEISTLGKAIVGSHCLRDRMIKKWGTLDALKSVTAIDLLGDRMVKDSETDLFVLSHENIENHLNFFESRSNPCNLSIVCAPISILEGKRFPINLLPSDALDRCDYAPFRNVQTKTLFITGGSPWYYHTIQDLPMRLDYTLLAQTHDFIYATLTADELDEQLEPGATTASDTSYSSQVIEKLIEMIKKMGENKTYYLLNAHDLKKINHMQSALSQLKNQKNNAKDAQNSVFDFLLLIHNVGKRMVKNSHPHDS